MPEELPLEPDLIKVLAADTRRDILSLLQDQRMTVTELSRELDLGKATVHEHLDKLTEVGLVERQEDDRLWVYYHLTGRGKRLLNPQRTRFYLALASALVAALVAGLAVYGFMMTGGVGGVGDTDKAAGGQMAVAVADDEVYAGDEIEVSAQIEGDDDVQAYLVDEDAASQIRQGYLDVRGLPMRAYTPPSDTAGEVQARDNTTLLRSDASLEPGTYYLYVREGTTDNAGTMPSVRLIGLEASMDRSTWFRGLDQGPLEVNVTRDGAPAQGTLRLRGADGAASPSVPVREGRARVPADTLDDLPLGTHRISVQPAGGDRWIDLPAQITVGDPTLAIHPLHVAEGSASLRVDLTGPDRLRALSPTVTGATADVRGHETGWTIDLADEDPGEARVSLARTDQPVAIHATAGVHAAVHDGPEVHWTLTDGRDRPLSDAAVYLDDRSQGFTDANGTLVTDLPDEGTHPLSIHRADGHVVTRAITVDGWTIEEGTDPLTVDPVDVASTGEQARITVDVTNPSPIPRPATLLGLVDGEPGAARGLEVPAAGTATSNLTVPVDAGRQPLSVQVDALNLGQFTYTNETTQDEAGEDEAETTDEGATETEATPGSTATVDLPTEDQLDTEDAPDAEPSKLEPIRPTDGAATGDQAAETPGPSALALLCLLFGAAWVVRARKP